MRMLKKILIVNSFFLIWILNAEAQQNLSDDSDERFNSIMIESGYTSNTSSFGTFSGNLRQPGISLSTLFASKHNFDLSVYGNAVANSDSSLSETTYETDLQAGYQILLPLKLKIYAAYQHSFYSKNSNLARSRFSDQGSLQLSYEGKIFNPQVTGIYLTGKQNEFMLDAGTAFNFEIDHFPFRSSSILIFPGADLMMGKLQFYNEYLLQQYQSHPLLFLRYYRYRKQLSSQEIMNLLKEEKKFTATSLSFSLPVSFSMGNWLVTGSAYAVKPLNQPIFMNTNWMFYFSGNLSYTINW